MYPTDMPKMKPSLHLNNKDLPEIKDWKVGETYEVIVKLKMESKMDFKKEISANFEISDILVPESENIDEMDAPTFEKYASTVKQTGKL